MGRPVVCALGVLVMLAFSPGLARAGSEPPTSTAAERHAEPAAYQKHETPLSPGGPYLHFLGALSLGEGLRFNNPYRLSTELGKSGESLSLTAPYVDVSAAGLVGHPDGLQHGISLHLSTAVQGVAQEVFTPSYIALVRLPPRWLVYGRAGIPVVLEPDATLGLELGAGGAWMASAGLGITAELVGSVYYGAATEQQPVTTIPVLSLQVGAVIDYEVLP